MKQIRVADYVAQFLYEQGIKDIFMLSGGGSIYLDDGIANSPINPVCVCNESTAPMMAEGYAKVNGNLGACMVTTGPGGANAVSGVVEAWVDSVPIIVISGQVETPLMSGGKNLRTYGTQELNICEVVRSITKYAVPVTHPDMIRYNLGRAVDEAHSGRKGPVWLDIPLDVQNAYVSAGDLYSYVPSQSPTAPSYDYIHSAEWLSRVVNNAEKPIFVVGQGVRQSGAIDDFMALAERIKIPIIVSRMGQDILSHNHPRYFGHAGCKGNGYANLILSEADLLIVLGSRLAPTFTNGNINGKILMVDIDRAELGKQEVNYPICADVKRFIDKALKVQPIEKNEWLDRCQQIKAEHPTIIPATDPIDIYYLMNYLDKNSRNGTVFVNDAGSNYYVAGQVLNFNRGQREVNSGTYASMGVGLPLAIGASIADRSRQVIAVIGDGSMELNIQELKTLKQVETNVKLFVVNNGGYVSIRNTQDSFGGKHIGSETGNVMNFQKIAAAFGLQYRKLEHISDLVSIPVYLSVDEPILIEVMCTTEQRIQ